MLNKIVNDFIESSDYDLNSSNATITLESGIIIKWGISPAPGNLTTSVNITFTEAFPNNAFCFQVLPASTSAAVEPISIWRNIDGLDAGFGKTGAVVRTNSSVGAALYWFAIGN